VVEQQVADHQNPIALAGEAHQLLGVLDAEGEWLLDVNVLARLEQRAGDGMVLGGRGGNDHALDVWGRGDVLEPNAGSRARMLRRGLREPRRIRVAERHQLRARQRGEIADQVGAPVSGPDHRDPDRLRHPPASSVNTRLRRPGRAV
jgi:hypothetical protein